WESLPMGSDDERLFWLDGQPKPESPADMNWAIDYVVGPEYLKVMQIPLQRGRFISMQDNERAAPIVVIDDVVAAKYFAGQNPVGRRIHLAGSDQPTEIVGVVGHVKQWGLDSDDTQTLRSQFYIPCMQMSDEYTARAPAGAGLVLRFNGAGSNGISTGIVDSL